MLLLLYLVRSIIHPYWFTLGLFNFSLHIQISPAFQCMYKHCQPFLNVCSMTFPFPHNLAYILLHSRKITFLTVISTYAILPYTYTDNHIKQYHVKIAAVLNPLSKCFSQFFNFCWFCFLVQVSTICTCLHRVPIYVPFVEVPHCNAV